MAWISGNRYLSLAEMTNNAQEIYSYARTHGWSYNALCAVLGNMQSESGINPGIWEGLQPFTGGYGLVQWTPYTKYSDWAGDPWLDNGPRELERISYEAANGIQWFYNSEIGMDPPVTFPEFLQSNLPIRTLADYWCWFYEHPTDPNQPIRGDQAEYWATVLSPYAASFPPWLLFKFKGRGV